MNLLLIFLFYLSVDSFKILRRQEVLKKLGCIRSVQEKVLSPFLPYCEGYVPREPEPLISPLDLYNLHDDRLDEDFNPFTFNSYNSRQMPGLITVQHGDPVALTSRDLRGGLQTGDEVRFSDNSLIDLLSPNNLNDQNDGEDENIGLYVVKSVSVDRIILTKPYHEENSNNMTCFKMNMDADDFISRIRSDAERNRKPTTTAKPITKPKTTTTTSAPFIQGCDVLLPGTVSMIHGSRIVTSSDDLRPHIAEGELILIRNYTFVVTEPRDEGALTLSSEFIGETVNGIPSCKTLGSIAGDDYTLLPGCVDVLAKSRIVRTSQDLTDYISNGETIRIRTFESTVMSPRDDKHLSVAFNYTLGSEKCIPAYKKKGGFSGGLIPLSGTISVTNNDNCAFTTSDLRGEISLNDIVVILGLKFHVTSPFTDVKMCLSSKWPDQSQSGLKAFKQANIVKLSGMINVVNNSPTVTTTVDLRAEIAPGDIVKILDDQFQIISPQDYMTFTLTVPYPGLTASGLFAYKVVGSQIELSGLFTIVEGSTTVISTADVRGEIGPGDIIEIATQRRTISGTMAAGVFNVDLPYTISAKLVPGYKVGKSADRITLEALALEKLKCKTIYCLAKLEQQERGIPYEFARNLGGGADGKATSIEALNAANAMADSSSSSSTTDMGFKDVDNDAGDPGEDFKTWIKNRANEVAASAS